MYSNIGLLCMYKYLNGVLWLSSVGMYTLLAGNLVCLCEECLL